jgi:hypothetical protein
MPPKGGGGSSQDLPRTLLIFLTRLKALKTSKRPSAADVLKAAAALDAAASATTHPWKDAFGSPSGLGLTQSFELAKDACATLCDLASYNQKKLLDKSQQRTCVRAALKAILALLPLHIKPGDVELLELLCNMPLVGVSVKW